LFFENREGFCFRDISVLYNQKEIQIFQENDFSAEVKTGPTDIGITQRNPQRDYQVVHAIRVDSVYDYLDAKTSGEIKSRLTTYDLLKKVHHITDYSVRNGTMNQYPLYP